jgi:hypothetical protein
VVLGRERCGGASGCVVAHRRGHARVNEAVMLRVLGPHRQNALAQAGPDADQGHAERRHVGRGREDGPHAGEHRRLVKLSLRHEARRIGQRPLRVAEHPAVPPLGPPRVAAAVQYEHR